ncbi:MAG: hypothetical protein DDT35_00999 [Firmicutes bacterium]|nr:hypothetical protein [Bacillota bacterium]
MPTCIRYPVIWASGMRPATAERTPSSTGVPTAPNETGVLLKMRAIEAAARGGKPKPTSRGAAKAAGVPKPAAPSTKAPNIQPMMMACTRRSLERPWKPLLMVAIAPLVFRVLSSSIAPKTIIKRFPALKAPSMVAAMILIGAIRHTNNPSTTAPSQTVGMAFLAGQLNTDIKTTVATMGRKANSASTPRYIAFPPSY